MIKTIKKIVPFTLIAATAMGLAACSPKPETGGDEYTYNAIFQTNPKSWNPHTWESNDDQIILSYTSMGFYDLQLTYGDDGAADGYEWVCEMAAEFPVDVTQDYVGKYGVQAGDRQKVWKIALNPQARWENGEKITADDYLYSMQQQLDPNMLNRRSDGYVGGEMAVYGAKTYLYSHTAVTYESLQSQGFESIDAALSDGAELFLDMWNFYGLQGATTPDGSKECPQWVWVNDQTVYVDPADQSEVTAKEIFENYKDYLEVGAEQSDCLAVAVENDNPDDNFAHVGIEKTGEYEIVLALTSSVSDYFVKYHLTSNWLVNKDVYERCKVNTGNLVSSVYGTSKDNYISYGPYLLESYMPDNSFVLRKNPAWYGYSDGKHENQFQTTAIKYTYVDGASVKETSLQMFMRGELDELSVDGDMMSDYGSSRYLDVQPETTTYQWFLCTDLPKLQGRDKSNENHSVLSLPAFRKALSYCVDRASFCAEYRPASAPGFSILNYSYAADPDTGLLYRDTFDAKRVILETNGFTQSDGKWVSYNGTQFDDIDSAYNGLTGYDPQYAGELFKQAYDEAKRQGIYVDGTPVVLDMCAVASSSLYTGLIATANRELSAALPANTFASVQIRLNTQYNTNETYWAAVKGGDADIAFAGWSGDPMSPWGIIFDCYINPANSNNYKLDVVAKNTPVTIDLTQFGKQSVTASFYDWSVWLANRQDDEDYSGENLVKTLGLLSDASLEMKIRILAEAEKAQILTYSNLPIFYSSVNSLRSAKYNNGSETFINVMIGFGGLRHITYNFTDAEWSKFVSDRGGNLQAFYKAS